MPFVNEGNTSPTSWGAIIAFLTVALLGLLLGAAQSRGEQVACMTAYSQATTDAQVEALGEGCGW